MNNTSVEMLWIDAWSDLYDLLAEDPSAEVIDEAGRILAEEEWKALIQTQAYTKQEAAHLERITHRGRPCIRLTFGARA